jgi:large subunit ribosomal protein L6
MTKRPVHPLTKGTDPLQSRNPAPRNFEETGGGIASTTARMFHAARRQCVRRVTAASTATPDFIPTFLLPAFQTPIAGRSFATTAPCLSKIGSAPLSVPPEVTFTVAEASTKGIGGRAQPMSTVYVSGPLGELSMNIPAYVNNDQDPALAGPTLTVQDPTDAKQRAMWGMKSHSAASMGS